jgi:hypothetical protein
MSEITELSRSAFRVLVAFLEEDGWKPTVKEETLTCHVAYQSSRATYQVQAFIDGETDHAVFRAQAPAPVPERMRHAAAEFLTRANFGLHIGNFEMDYRDGEVRFKTSLDFEDVGLTPKVVHNHLYAAVEALDRYVMGLMSVASGAKTPLQAIRDIEG